MIERIGFHTGSLPVAGSDGCIHGGGDNPGPGGPQVTLAFHEKRIEPLFPA